MNQVVDIDRRHDMAATIHVGKFSGQKHRRQLQGGGAVVRSINTGRADDRNLKALAVVTHGKALPLCLGCYVGVIRPRGEGGVLGNVGLAGKAVDTYRTDMDNTLDAGLAGRFHNIPDALDIDPPEGRPGAPVGGITGDIIDY